MLIPLKEPVAISDYTKDWIIRDKVNVEAGWVNNPKDLGKETKCGVTAATAAEYKDSLVKLFGWNGQMKDLTPEMAMWIFNEGWWKKLCLDEIATVHPFLADRMFDFGINAGRKRGALALQEQLNVLNRQGRDYPDLKPDGAISSGGATIQALKAFVKVRGAEGVLVLVDALCDYQAAHYRSISESRPDNEEFTYGWYQRVRHARRRYYKLLPN